MDPGGGYTEIRRQERHGFRLGSRPWLVAAVLAAAVARAPAADAAPPGQPGSGAAAPPSFHFTVTSDLHLRVANYGRVLDAIQTNSGGQGAFQVSIGDICDRAGQTPATMRELIDAHFGAAAVWYPGVGNHDASVAATSASMTWRRAEFSTGNGVRRPLRATVLHPGPAGTAETTYSWDYANAHFVMLNEYWDGASAPGSDVATDGDIVPELRVWLAADLAANRRPFVFVFGHEPAYPELRHQDNSLNRYPDNRDAFWHVLARHHVQAFICGHVHYYYKGQHDGVWEISDGNAGNGDKVHYQSYLDVIVGPAQAIIKVWQNDADGSTVWHLADTIMLPAATPGVPAPEPVAAR